MGKKRPLEADEVQDQIATIVSNLHYLLGNWSEAATTC